MTKPVEIDWQRVLACCNAALDAGTQRAKVGELTTPELVYAITLALMQVIHATTQTPDRGAAAVAMRSWVAVFCAEWAAGNIPIDFPDEPKEAA